MHLFIPIIKTRARSRVWRGAKNRASSNIGGVQCVHDCHEETNRVFFSVFQKLKVAFRFARDREETEKLLNHFFFSTKIDIISMNCNKINKCFRRYLNKQHYKSYYAPS